jgi:hypothetical protein
MNDQGLRANTPDTVRARLLSPFSRMMKRNTTAAAAEVKKAEKYLRYTRSSDPVLKRE